VREREGGGEGRGAAHFAGAVAPLRGEYGPDSDRRCILSPPPPPPSRGDVIAMLVDNIIDLYNYVECIFEERFACSE